MQVRALHSAKPSRRTCLGCGLL